MRSRAARSAPAQPNTITRRPRPDRWYRPPHAAPAPRGARRIQSRRGRRCTNTATAATALEQGLAAGPSPIWQRSPRLPGATRTSKPSELHMLPHFPYPSRLLLCPCASCPFPFPLLSPLCLCASYSVPIRQLVTRHSSFVIRSPIRPPSRMLYSFPLRTIPGRRWRDLPYGHTAGRRRTGTGAWRNSHDDPNRR